MTKTLYHIDRDLFDRTQKVLLQNKEERHIRGGEATRRKYLELRPDPLHS